jgi:uncharacterized protein (TIGR03435 family)
MRRALYLALVALIVTPPALVQTPTPLAFDVASVKPALHGRDAAGWSRSSVDVPSPGRLLAENSSLDELIRFAYDLKEYQISGPAWLNDESECFDIVAKAPSGYSRDQVRIMLQTLLMERFKMAAHRETKVLPIYELSVGKNGPRLQAADPASRKRTSSGGGSITATRVTMADFAYELSRQLNRPVLDKTGIGGAFDITLRYTQDEDAASPVPPLFAAIENTLGLRVLSAKGPIAILVIDHIEKAPTEQ